jgi:hypothetical protein
MKFIKLPHLATLAVTFLAVAHVQAATNYGTFVGSTVTFQDVTEWSPSGDPLPLYGAPTIIGNTMDFTPSFFSSASNGASDTTDGTLSFLLKANPGNAISSVLFSERGDFTFAGVGGANTFVSVTATFFIDIYKVDGVALLTPIQLTEFATFSPNALGIFDKATYPTPPTRIWTAIYQRGDRNQLRTG